MQGQEALLIAPTAGGKTLAYLAPLVQRHVVPGDRRPRLLIVSPTRALVNDLYRRIRPRLEELGIDVGRWTGDHHDGGRLHAVTLLTPEGLDSRLSRAPEAICSVRALVLDELHVLEGSVRGDHLRVLVQRMRVERRDEQGPLPLQVVAASATVARPEALARRWLQDGVVIRAGDRRPIVARVVTTHDEGLAALLCQHAREGSRKVLLFCNRRRDVEVLVRLLRDRPPFHSAVFAHHGSLSRSRRLDVERRFLAAPVGCCVATSTLELGIDIGDIDIVVCHGVPPSVASLLQRAGRGNRRGRSNPLLILVDNRFDATRARTLLEAQRDGHWHDGPRVFRASVLVQQALSILQARSNKTITAKAMARRLPRHHSEERLEALLEGMALAGWLERIPGSYRLGPRAEREWGYGRLHANLSEDLQVEVIDSTTGEAIGTVEDLSAGVGIGGRGRVPLVTQPKRVVTRSADTDELPRWARVAPRRMPSALARAFLVGADLPWPVRVQTPRGTALVHGLGDAGGALLVCALEGSGLMRRARIKSSNPYACLIEGRLDAWPGPEHATAALRRSHDILATRVSPGRFHGDLPTAERVEVIGLLCELDRVEELLAAGSPPLYVPTDPELFAQVLAAR